MISRRLPRLTAPILALLSVLFAQSCARASFTAATSAPANSAGSITTTVSVDGRAFTLYSPPSIENRLAPLVLVLHGALGNAEGFEQRFPLRGEAARSGFHLAYLDGTSQGPRMRASRRTWNAGDCCGTAKKQGINDVAYLSNVINTLTQRRLTTPRQVYLVGFSNGAMMSFRFACERNTMLGGAVTMAGALVRPTCTNAAGVRILHVHGLQDTNVPVSGGGGGMGERLTGDGGFPPLEQTRARLRSAGASMQTILLQGGEHSTRTLDTAMQRERGTSLANVVGNFVRGL